MVIGDINGISVNSGVGWFRQCRCLNHALREDRPGYLGLLMFVAVRSHALTLAIMTGSPENSLCCVRCSVPMECPVEGLVSGWRLSHSCVTPY